MNNPTNKRTPHPAARIVAYTVIFALIVLAMAGAWMAGVIR